MSEESAAETGFGFWLVRFIGEASPDAEWLIESPPSEFELVWS